MTEHFIPSLTIDLGEPVDGERTVLLQQEFGGDMNRVELHALHVRMLAEKMGVVLFAERERLERALLRAWDLADQLHDSVKSQHLRGHEDLTLEMAEGEALAGFLAFICADFEDGYEPLKPARAESASTQAAPYRPTPANAGPLFDQPAPEEAQ